MLHVGSFAFDAVMMAVFGGLFSGATLAVGKPNSLTEFLYISNLLAEQLTSFLFCTPSWLTSYRLFGLRMPPCLCVLHSGGEALSLQLAQDFGREDPHIAFTNGCGPTETTVYANVLRLETQSQIKGNSVPIGPPIWNTSCVVGCEEQAAGGTPGELRLGGPRVSRGYVGRADLTCNAFNVAGRYGRMYKTGDRVRWLSSGDIEYMGRLDMQVSSVVAQKTRDKPCCVLPGEAEWPKA